MKKVLLPALAITLTLGSAAAFAQSGYWYVLRRNNSHSCFAAHRVNEGSKEEMMGGPYPSQGAAITALYRVGECVGLPTGGSR